MKIITQIKDWWHGWNEPESWERDALALIEVMAQDATRHQRGHPSDKDCWCQCCCGDKAVEWINAYWERRLKKTRLSATMSSSNRLIVMDRE